LVISDSLFVLGRRFFIDDSLRPVLSLIYLALISGYRLLRHAHPAFIHTLMFWDWCPVGCFNCC
jgi:hypothetical protein